MAAPPTTTQKLLAEGLGTVFLVFVGAGSAAATGVIAAGTKVAFSMAQLGVISFAFMLVIVGAVYAIGHISGGHINPAVTLALAFSGKFPWREVPGYVVAQLVGATAGAAAIFLTLGKAATIAAGGGVTSYNAASMGFGRASLIEAIGTFMLVFVIFGVIDHRAVPGWAPMAIGSVVFAIIIILGPATGAAINPARYLGTVFMQAGFGGTVSWAQVPAYVIGELVGGVLGGLAYVFIGRVRADAAMTSLAPDAGATVFVEKIAGTLAEEGAGLAAVAAVAREVNERSRSFGVALSSCVVPAAGKPTFELGEAEAELGIGIHGEPGRTRAARRSSGCSTSPATRCRLSSATGENRAWRPCSVPRDRSMTSSGRSCARARGPGSPSWCRWSRRWTRSPRSVPRSRRLPPRSAPKQARPSSASWWRSPPRPPRPPSSRTRSTSSPSAPTTSPAWCLAWTGPTRGPVLRWPRTPGCSR